MAHTADLSLEQYDRLHFFGSFYRKQTVGSVFAHLFAGLAQFKV